MTEAQFLAESSKDFETIASQMDSQLAKATETTWQATRTDNDWTTAQIVEHICLAAKPCESQVAEALAQAKPSDGSSPVGLAPKLQRFLRWFYTKHLPVPGSLRVTERIEADTALAHWGACKQLLRSQLEAAQGKCLSHPWFGNPVLPLFKITVADHMAVQLEHLRHHAEQIALRVTG